MKNHLKIVIFIFIFAISNFIGLGKVRGEEEIDYNAKAKDGGAYYTPTSSCLNNYHYCISGNANNDLYYIIEVYDIRANKSTFYYDIKLSNNTSSPYFEGHFYDAIGNNKKPIYKIDIASTFFDSSFNRSDPKTWGWESKWYNLFSDFKTTLSDGSQQIKSNKFTNWLYLKQYRSAAKYDSLADATADLKKYGQLYIVRISAGLIILNRNGYGGNVDGRPLVAIDRIFNEKEEIDPNRNTINKYVDEHNVEHIDGDMNYFTNHLQLGRDNSGGSCCNDADGYNCSYKMSCDNRIAITDSNIKQEKFKICTYASSIFKAVCGNGFLDNAAWFTDYGHGIDPEPEKTCKDYCSTDGIGKYGSTTACNNCCKDVDGQYVINETSDQCSNIPTCLKPSSLPPEPAYGEVKCGGTYNIDFYENAGNICDNIPKYNHIVANIDIPNGSITLLNNSGRLVSNPFAVAGKGFNWNTTFDGEIISNGYIDPLIKNKYNQYLNCVINRNTQINSAIAYLRDQQKNVSGNAYNDYQTEINTLTNLLTSNEELITISNCNTTIQNFFNSAMSSDTHITNADIQIDKKHFDAVGYNIGQEAGDIKLIPKNFGDPFSNYDDIKSFIKQELDFFVPITIPNKTRGILSLSATINNQYLRNSEKGQISIECPIVISSYVECQDDDKCTDDDDHYDDDDDDTPPGSGDDDDDTPPGGGGDDDTPCDPNDPNCHFVECQDDDKCLDGGDDDNTHPGCDPNDPDCPFVTCDDPNGCTTGLNLIYRPISLKDPFPNRTQGYNWKGTYNGKTYKEIFITNSRAANDNEIYRQDPMYVITLTPTDIKEIREYNKQHSYNDFNLKCDEYGLQCRSEFIKTTYRNLFESGTCGLDGDWYACYSQNPNQKNAVEKILNPMKW